MRKGWKRGAAPIKGFGEQYNKTIKGDHAQHMGLVKEHTEICQFNFTPRGLVNIDLQLVVDQFVPHILVKYILMGREHIGLNREGTTIKKYSLIATL